MCHTCIVKIELTQALGMGAYFAPKKEFDGFFKVEPMLVWLVSISLIY